MKLNTIMNPVNSCIIFFYIPRSNLQNQIFKSEGVLSQRNNIERLGIKSGCQQCFPFNKSNKTSLKIPHPGHSGCRNFFDGHETCVFLKEKSIMVRESTNTHKIIK